MINNNHDGSSTSAALSPSSGGKKKTSKKRFQGIKKNINESGSASEEKIKLKTNLPKKKTTSLVKGEKKSQVIHSSTLKKGIQLNTTKKIVLKSTPISPVQNYKPSTTIDSAKQKQGGGLQSQQKKEGNDCIIKNVQSEEEIPLISMERATSTTDSASDKQYSSSTSAVVDMSVAVTQEDHPASHNDVAITSMDVEEETKEDIPIARPSLSTSSGWGPSFGTSPAPLSQQVAPSPLSSWYLSKGSANFIKRTSFPTHELSPCNLTPQNEPSSIASVRTDAFFKELAQANWRVWYGQVDPHTVVDPPLSSHTPLLPLEVAAGPTPAAVPVPPPAAPTSSRRPKTAKELLEQIRAEKVKSRRFQADLYDSLTHE